MEFLHKSVLLEECIENLNIKNDGIYVDATLGGAGHSTEICKRLTCGRLVGIDADSAAIEKGGQVLNVYRDKVTLIHGNYSGFKKIINDLGIDAVNGILLDLGVSSYQLDMPERGFSYMNDGKLDMRMDEDADLSAYDVVNGYSASDLTRIISKYGEERWAKRIADFIVTARKVKPIETTFELVGVIKNAVPKAARQDGPHPAKRTFQAIRIEVNSELTVLSDSISEMAQSLAPGGRLCIISFHSLEDRIVKHALRDLENPCICPPELPVCVCNKKPILKTITRKPIIPSQPEIEQNHRSRSAKLRVAERI